MIKIANKYYLIYNKLETNDFIRIDELSMTEGCTFDNIVEIIEFINKYIKLINVGDCTQPPPVDKSKSVYYFNCGEYDSLQYVKLLFL